MPGYAVDPATLDECDAALAGAVGFARAALDRLRTDADEVLAGWRGPAANAFGLAWAEWLDGVHAMLAALDELAHQLGTSATSYATTEDAVRTSLAGALR